MTMHSFCFSFLSFFFVSFVIFVVDFDI